MRHNPVCTLTPSQKIAVSTARGRGRLGQQAMEPRCVKEGETVSITLGTEVVKARALNVTAPLPAKERGELVYEVHAAEN